VSETGDNSIFAYSGGVGQLLLLQVPPRPVYPAVKDKLSSLYRHLQSSLDAVPPALLMLSWLCPQPDCQNDEVFLREYSENTRMNLQGGKK